MHPDNNTDTGDTSVQIKVPPPLPPPLPPSAGRPNVRESAVSALATDVTVRCMNNALIN